MAAPVISLFNHKGGVSKTTTTFNLGWALAERGHRVMIVDADPQCNLTGMALDFSGFTDFAEFYENNPLSNLFNVLRPAFSGQPKEMEAAHLVKTLHENLLLLAGHIDLATYEPELAMAHKLGTAMPILQNLPGAAGHLFKASAEAYNVNIILVDMSPSVGPLNQNLFLQSDFFIVPTSPDYFCQLAIESLSRVLPQWNSVAENLRSMQENLTYKLPNVSPKFVGMISQRYRPRSGGPSSAFQRWIDIIVDRVQKMLVPALEPLGMTLTADEYNIKVKDTVPFELAQISDFNALIARSQEQSVPIFALTDTQLGTTGIIQKRMKKSRNSFRSVFEKLAQDVENLCLN